MDAIPNGLIHQLRFLVGAGNLGAALEYLNLQSGLRFTALHRSDTDGASSFLLVDRDDPSPATPQWLRRNAQYRSFVEAMAGVPVRDDASADLDGVIHPDSGPVLAYCGLPLRAEEGAVSGTLCQFDLAPVAIPASTIGLMRELVAALGSTAVRETQRTYLEARVDRLSDMQDVIAAAADAGDDARQMFDSFADPLRAEAFRKLDPGSALALEARISAIWSNVSSKR